jgi:hypothetical protein
MTAAVACGSGTGPDDREIINGEAPRPLMLKAGPEIWLDTLLDSSVYLLFRVTAPDSTFAINWWPTQLIVETDRGYQDTLLLAPVACLLPESSGTSFPFTFTWWACDIVGINTSVILSPDRLQQMEQAVSGQELYMREFKTMPGAYYAFRVPAGLTATAEAVRRLARFPGVSDAFRENAEPVCYISDIVPPPPCDPWWLATIRPFTFSDVARGDSLPVRHGGWVRATYTQSDGTILTTTFQFP